MAAATDEQIIAYVDGTLSPKETAEFEQLLAHDQELAERVADHRWLVERIASAYGPSPVEDFSATVVALPAASRSPKNSSGKWWANAVAMAASLVLGIFVGGFAFEENKPFRTGSAGGLLAAGPLADALAKAPSGQKSEYAVGLTFRSAEAHCRTFVTKSGMSGLGCLEGGNWSVRALIEGRAETEPMGEYQLAGAAVDPRIMAEVDRIIVGDPIAPAEEARLIQSSWNHRLPGE